MFVKKGDRLFLKVFKATLDFNKDENSLTESLILPQRGLDIVERE